MVGPHHSEELAMGQGADGVVTARPTARRMFELVEPIGVLPYGDDALDEVVGALGLEGIWDGYFAGRAAALGPVPAEVVHALFYNFFPGEVARHIPRVWEVTTPEAAFAARDEGCVRALRRALGDVATTPAVARAADLLAQAAMSAPTEGRAMYAALRGRPLPEEPLHRLFRAATLLREHRGDGHVAALVSHGVGGTESHFLAAIASGMPGAEFGRVHHRPRAELAAIEDGLRSRGLVDGRGRFTAAGRDMKDRIEALTDELAQAPYDALTDAELRELVAGLEPVAACLNAGMTD
jgi:hypothetical protein